MHEAYLVKGDQVLPASCPGESLLPSLWHSFALSLSGGEAEAEREKQRKRERRGEGSKSREKYEEMACKNRADLEYRGRDTGEEGEETKKEMRESGRG